MSLLLLAAYLWSADHTVILVSFDGMRWDYPRLAETPHVQELSEKGFTLKRLVPEAPSLTFPNHYSLVTGKSPVEHGVLYNTMYDRGTKNWFTLAQAEEVGNSFWYQAEPIWHTAHKNGIPAYVYFWAGSETDAMAPTLSVPFDREQDPRIRLETLRSWLERPPQTRPGFVAMYFYPTDGAGHYHGPDSPELLHAVREADWIIGQIAAMIEETGNQADCIIVADHGMTPILGPVFSYEEIETSLEDLPVEVVVNNHSMVDIFLSDTSPEVKDAVIARLPKHPHWHWLKDRPAERNHPTRSGDIVGYADLGYQIPDSRGIRYYGGHGYDTEEPDMSAFCMGFGPSFAAGSHMERRRVREVHDLLMFLLRLSPDPGPWAPVLKESQVEERSLQP